jgi:hypothetical protein
MHGEWLGCCPHRSELRRFVFQGYCRGAAEGVQSLRKRRLYHIRKVFALL